MKAYFHKQLFSTPCYLSTGSAAPFVAFGDDEGYLVTSHEWLIGELRDCQKRGVGGVIEVTEDALAELKKKPARNSYKSSQPNPEKFLQSSIAQLKKRSASPGGAATVSPEAATTPEAPPTPKVRVTDIAVSRPKAGKVTRS